MNVYDTNDPVKLLQLKRQEADALRDVIRSIYGSRLKPEQFFKITQNVLLAQLRVRKMKFVYRLDGEFVIGLSWRLGEMNEDALLQLSMCESVTEVDAECHPDLFRLGVEFMVPLNFRRGINAWFLVAEFAESDAERENDLIFIETIGNVLAAAVENHILVEEAVRQESIRKELDLAGKIQNQLLIKDFSDIVQADIHTHNLQHHGVGGDFYDVISRGERGFFLCIADVAGKGIAAALLMANLQANLRALILSQNSLADIIQKLHQTILEITRGERFVTLFLAHIEANQKKINYINAGHNPPVMLMGGKLVKLTEGTIPLGILDLPPFVEGAEEFHSGDTLFLYTDGLVEQPDPSDQLYGEERMNKVLSQLSQGTPQEIIAGMEQDLAAFGSGRPADDDITMVAVRFR